MSDVKCAVIVMVMIFGAASAVVAATEPALATRDIVVTNAGR